MGPAAVTFDLDDTLAVVERPRTVLLEDAAMSVGAPSLSRQAYLETHASVNPRDTRAPIFERLLDDVEADGADPEDLAVAYRQTIGTHLRPVDGVEAMLDKLDETVGLGLITNGPERAQRDKLERLGWTDRFDTVVISGRVGVAKPDPRPFEVACDRLGVDPAEAIHIGDQPVADIMGARQAGMDAIYVGDDPEGVPDDVPHIPVDHLAMHLPDRILQKSLA